MTWLTFVFSAAVIVGAAIKLAEYGDVIALRTRLSGMFVGTLLLAGATSMPELLTSINAIDQGVPNLTVGNIFGSCMFNMALLAGLDLVYWRSRILRRLSIAHSLSSGVAVGLTGLAMLFILAQFDATIGWVGLDSLAIMIAYLAATRLLFAGNRGAGADAPIEEVPVAEGVPTLRYALIGFGAATLVLVGITPLLVSNAVDIAEQMGLSAGFVGVALVGVITSLPEVVTTIQAARIGAYDLAAGNLFGSNIFNIFTLGLTDVFFTDGRFLAEVSPTMVLAGVIALLMMHIALMGMLVRNLVAARQTRQLVIETDSLLILGGYVLGMWLLYARGLVG